MVYYTSKSSIGGCCCGNKMGDFLLLVECEIRSNSCQPAAYPPINASQATHLQSIVRTKTTGNYLQHRGDKQTVRLTYFHVIRD